MILPHLIFVGTLLLSPVISIVTVTAGDPWRWPGVALSAGLVSAAAATSFLALRTEDDGERPRILRMRMMGVTGSVAVAACVLAVFSLALAING